MGKCRGRKERRREGSGGLRREGTGDGEVLRREGKEERGVEDREGKERKMGRCVGRKAKRGRGGVLPEYQQ